MMEEGLSYLQYLGISASLYLLVRFCIVTSSLLRLFLSRPVDVTKLGSWAVVTGATDGIGKAYTFALANKGMNVVLVSRSKDKLNKVAAEVEDKCRVKTKSVVVDFSREASSYTTRLKKELEGLEIGVLINNVGMNHTCPDEFLALTKSDRAIQRLFHVNMTSATAVTRLILPQMVSRGNGAVVNVSSICAALPSSPLLSVYSATKAYTDKLCCSLAAEYRGTITFQSLMPGFVCGRMSGFARSSTFVPTPETLVESAIGRLGVWERTTGYWAYDLQLAYYRAFPAWFAERSLMKRMVAARQKLREKRTRN